MIIHQEMILAGFVSARARDVITLAGLLGFVLGSRQKIDACRDGNEKITYFLNINEKTSPKRKL